MTEPLVPAECTMAGNEWFPLHFDRLRKSKWWRRASDTARARNVMMWGEAYKAVPAGSLPDDDDELAEAAGYGMDVAAFIAAKDEIMAPWVLCTDGRWYHPTVCEVVLEAWERISERRRVAAQRKADQRAKVRGHGVRNQPVPHNDAGHPPADDAVPPQTANVPRDNGNVPRDTGENGRDIGTQDKTRQDRTYSDPYGSGAEAPGEVERTSSDPLESLRSLDRRTGAWRLALRVLMNRGGFNEARARPLVGKWTQEFGADQVWDAAEAAWNTHTLDPVSYITAALREMSTRDENPLLTPSEARQRAWAQDYRENPNQWREHERGPKPGHEGCRISPAILEEFGLVELEEEF